MPALADHAAVSPRHFDDEPLTDSHHHSLGLTKERDAMLRDKAIAADNQATVELSLALLWRELSRGLCKVTDSFFTDTRCLLLTTPAAGPAVPLQGRRLRILEAVLTGVGQKNIAIEMGLAPSTIALNARLALDGLGVRGRPSRAHPLLMLAAKADQAGDARLTATLSFVTHRGELIRVISVPRPDGRLRSTLPPAELAVVQRLVEGACYEDIAQRRGTSTRTIANQITAVFRRMKVSGRSELLLHLFAEGAHRSTSL